jgi:hypothetical protein
MVSWREKLETALTGGNANTYEIEAELLKTLQIDVASQSITDNEFSCTNSQVVVVTAGGEMIDGSFSFAWKRERPGESKQLLKGFTSSTFSPSVDDVGSTISVEVSCAKNRAVRGTANYGPIVIDPSVMAKSDAIVVQGFAEFPPAKIVPGLVGFGVPTTKVLFRECPNKGKGGLTLMRSKIEAMIKERNARNLRSRGKREEKRKADAIERDAEDEARMREELEQYWQQWQEDTMSEWLHANNGPFEDFMQGAALRYPTIIFWLSNQYGLCPPLRFPLLLSLQISNPRSVPREHYRW